MKRLLRGESQATICQLTGFDPWFVAQMGEIADFERDVDQCWTRRRCARPSGWASRDSQLARIVQARPATGNPLELR